MYVHKTLRLMVMQVIKGQYLRMGRVRRICIFIGISRDGITGLIAGHMTSDQSDARKSVL